MKSQFELSARDPIIPRIILLSCSLVPFTMFAFAPFTALVGLNTINETPFLKRTYRTNFESVLES